MALSDFLIFFISAIMMSLNGISLSSLNYHIISHYLSLKDVFFCKLTILLLFWYFFPSKVFVLLLLLCWDSLCILNTNHLTYIWQTSFSASHFLYLDSVFWLNGILNCNDIEFNRHFFNSDLFKKYLTMPWHEDILQCSLLRDYFHY